MPHRDNEGQKRDKMVAISIQDQILGSSILPCFLEITGKGGERGEAESKCGRPTVTFPWCRKERRKKCGETKKKEKKKKGLLAFVLRIKKPIFCPSPRNGEPIFA